MKKRWIFLFAAALVLMSAAGCGKQKEEVVIMTPAPTPAATVDPHEGMVEVPDGVGGTMWITESAVLAPFEADRNAFAVTDSSAVYNGTGWTLVPGIDVSEYQGEIDWQAVADSGIRFVMLRCAWRGYSSGSLNEDARFRSNLEGAHAAGLEVGVYCFSQATGVYEAAEEAVFTVNCLNDCELELPVFYDWEWINDSNARTDGMDGETITDCALEFCRLIALAGYTPGVYSNLNLAYNYLDLDALEGIDFWFAGPSGSPAYYYDHQFWQYSFSGTVDGIDADVDMDVMYVRDDGPETETVLAEAETPTESVETRAERE